jgi:hypothetical protein
MSTVKEIIEDAYTKVNGEYEILVESSDDFKTYLRVLNIVMKNLCHMPYVKWRIFFDMEFDLPDAVADGTLSYTIPDISSIDIANSPTDHIFFMSDDIVVAKYKLVSLSIFQSTSNTQVATVAGDKLYLKATESKILGTTIRLPVYKDPAPYATADQEVLVDSTPWLVASMATFICASSPVPFIARNADRYEKEAAVFMKQMRDVNKQMQALILTKLNAPIGRTWEDVMNVMTLKDL